MKNRLVLPEDKAREIAESLWYRHIDNTVIAVVQDYETKDVLMVAYMNKEAVIKTLTTGLAHFWSTTRKKLWMKGETSGNIQEVLEFRVDCDKDAVLLIVKPRGPACHLGYRSCFDAWKIDQSCV
ncbi:MAG: phosphoribosyl-AMP cyclohydrolase [Crenarchaeota archaeon]|nr:phosphoribosyl-AMP cyclohydrolase [Thermoproteota archaeon]